MAVLDISISSRILHPSNEIKVILPQSGRNGPNHPPYRTVWWLHGGNGDCNQLLGNTSLVRYAERYNLAMVLGSIYNSFGMDMQHGDHYATFLEKEFMPAVRRVLPCLSRRREDNFGAGVSMGGFAVFRWAMNNPDAFCRVGAFAGALAMPVIFHRFVEGTQPGGVDFFNAFGSEERLTGNENDILHMLRKNRANGTDVPKLFMLCGTEDFGWDLNDWMRAELVKAGADLTFRAVPGTHSYDCWDPHICGFLDWLLDQDDDKKGAI
jgi:putative tributyrin esterase